MNFDQFPQVNSKTDKGGKNENFEFTLDARQATTIRFLELLREETELVEIDQDMIRGIVSEETIEANRNLTILRRALQRLANDPVFPDGKLKTFLKVQLLGLSPMLSTDVARVSTYALAVKDTLCILKKILTEDVYNKFTNEAKGIFIPPFEDQLKSI